MTDIDEVKLMMDRLLWRPIETAPRNEAVLIGGGDILYPIVASWSGLPDEAWCLDYQSIPGDEIDGWPMYWMPLPELPSTILEDGA